MHWRNIPENSLECNSKTDGYRAYTDEESRKEVEREKKQYNEKVSLQQIWVPKGKNRENGRKLLFKGRVPDEKLESTKSRKPMNPKQSKWEESHSWAHNVGRIPTMEDLGLILDWKPEHLTQGQFNSCSPATMGDLRPEEAVHKR